MVHKRVISLIPREYAFIEESEIVELAHSTDGGKSWQSVPAFSHDIYGTSNFDGPGGITITHNFGSTDYDFRIRPNADGGGAIGDIWIDNLAANTIVVHNSGSGVTGFAWHLFAKD